MARATWRELARPILVSNVTTALGFGLLAVIPVTPVQEMAIFGAAGELLSGLHVVFVLPMCLFWFGAAARARGRAHRCLPANSGRPTPSARSRAWLTRLQRFRFRLLVPDGRRLRGDGVADLDGELRLDLSHMIQPNERLRIDYARFDAAGLPSAQLSIVIRRSNESPVVDAALNAAIVKATAEIEALPEVTKVVGPASIFAEVAPALAGDGSAGAVRGGRLPR